MKIGVISDTHGDAINFDIALNNILYDVELIIHAGDILNHGPRNKIPEGYNPVKLAELINTSPIDIFFAKGNCDSEVDELLINYFISSPYLYLMVEGVRLFVSHGHINFSEYLKKAKQKCDIFIFGHTHIYTIEKEDNIVQLNPGSLSLPKNNPNGTCAIINIDSNEISIFDIKNREPLAEMTI